MGSRTGSPHRPAEPAVGRGAAAGAPRQSSAEQALRKIPTDRLAAELQRRGWIVVEP